jgi:hypothetical protein
MMFVEVMQEAFPPQYSVSNNEALFGWSTCVSCRFSAFTAIE